jgi:hypothetical protein
VRERSAGLGQHPLVDVRDQAGLLGERQELGRRLQASLGMLPVDQRLERVQAVVGQRDDGLVVALKAGPLDRVARPRLELELVGRLVGLDTAASALGLVHREVRFPDELLERGLLAAGAGDPDAGLERHLGAVQCERLRDRAPRPLGHSLRLALAAQVVVQDHELIAAVARDGVARAQHPL